MSKKLLNALLCGVAILAVSVLASCKNDLSHVNSRLAALEGYYTQIQDQLASALREGNSITSYEMSGNNYVITLNNGQKISIPVGGEGGGSSVTVDTDTPGFVTITVNDEEYTFAVGSAVTSLVYRPEFEDGYVALGQEDAIVKFLAAPAVSDITGATFSVADVYTAAERTRAGNGVLMSVPNGTGTLDGEFINVPLRALEVVGGQSYQVSIQMSLNGTVINSNYFTVKVDEGYTAKPEEIDESIIPIADYSPVLNADKSYTITVDGYDMLMPLNVKDFYGTTLPAGATFKVAPEGKQPAGDAQGKQAMLAASLATDGTWAFTERPGTTFGEVGFQIEVLVNDEVKARTNITITDPLKDVNFTTLAPNGEHLEIPREIFPIGANTYDIPAEINADNFSERHGGAATFIEAFKSYQIMAGEEMVLMNNGERIIATEYGQAMAKNSRGVYWINGQTSIAASVGIGGNGEIISGWDGLPGPDMEAMGLSITPDGKFVTNENYGGWGVRVGMGVRYEWAYGEKNLGNDWLCFIWFNRRVCDPAVVDPLPR